MKPAVLATILSLSALGMAAALFLGRSPHQSTAPLPEAGEAASSTDPSDTTRQVPVTIGSTAREARGFRWSQVESTDYKTYIANLRSMGCPEQTIRDLIIADVNKLYAERERPLRSPAPDDSGTDLAADEIERRRQLREIQLEKRAVLKELLDVEVPLDLLPSSGSRNYDAFEMAFNFLPAAKRDAVQTLQENYWQKSDELKKAFNQQQTPEYLAQYRQLNDQLREELKKILTPEELEDFDLRTSPTAKKLATQLATTFGPSETEFRKIFRATQQRDAQLERLDPLPAANRQASPEERQQINQQRKAINDARNAINTQFNDQLRSELSGERFTDYQRSQDSAYEVLTRLGIRYGLEQDTVLQAYNLQKNFKKPEVPQGADAMTRRALTTEANNQLNQQLAAILGEQAARGYNRVRNPDGSTRN